MQRIFFDFETRSRLDVSKHGAYRYANDPSTVVLCMAYATQSGPVELWTPGSPLPKFLLRPGEYLLTAHNANFERSILRFTLKLPDHPLGCWDCTASRSAAYGLPRALAKVAKALGLNYQKDEAGHRAMLRLTKPRKPTKNKPEEWIGDPEVFETVYGYCRQDVHVERAIHFRVPSLEPFERGIFELDLIINDRGVPFDLGSVRALRATLQRQAATLTDELRELTGGAVGSAKEVANFRAWLSGQDVELPNLRAETVAAVLAGPLPPGPPRRALEIRHQLGRSSVSKLDAILRRADTDGRVRGSHVHYGAGTGRFAGQGVQLQNLPRGNVKPDEIDLMFDLIESGLLDVATSDLTGTAAGLIRPMIRAPEGYDFAVIDFAQIEARVLAWLADEKETLDAFRRGDDIYSIFAAKLFNTSDVSKDQRQVGKVAILGLGYSMGANRFVDFAANYGVAMSFENAQGVVDLFRSTHSRIRRFWYNLGDAAIEAARTGRRVWTQDVPHDRSIQWHKKKDVLDAILPSGRAIRYYDPSVIYVAGKYSGKVPVLQYWTVDSYTKQWTKRRAYGGLLTENIVQGLSRDILAAAMFRLEQAGRPVIFHVHDEVIATTPSRPGQRKQDLAALEALVAKPPSWALTCPIAAEGFIAKRYRK